MVYGPENANIFQQFVQDPSSCEGLIVNNQHSIAIQNKFPKTPIHVLVLPKGLYKNIHEFLQESTIEEQNDFWKTVNEIILLFNLYKIGFNIVFNTLESHGQEIFHMHCHVMSKGNDS